MRLQAGYNECYQSATIYFDCQVQEREDNPGDTLSRTYLTEVHLCDTSQEFEAFDHTASLAIPANQWQQLKDVSFHAYPYFNV